MGMALVERNLVPDAVLRAGIRRNLREKCVVRYKNVEDELEREQEFIEDLRRRETIAEATDAANEQHYEVPTAFYELCLGSRLKYSCCLYEDDEGEGGLDGAELACWRRTPNARKYAMGCPSSSSAAVGGRCRYF